MPYTSKAHATVGMGSAARNVTGQGSSVSSVSAASPEASPEAAHVARLASEAAAVTAALHHLYITAGLYSGGSDGAEADGDAAGGDDPEDLEAAAAEDRADELEVLASIYEDRLENYNEGYDIVHVWRWWCSMFTCTLLQSEERQCSF